MSSGGPASQLARRLLRAALARELQQSRSVLVCSQLGALSRLATVDVPSGHPRSIAFGQAFSTAAASPAVAALRDVCDEERKQLSHIRNIGISAHIDSGKTTLTERILYYTGRIKDVHEVRGKDGVGAKMDHMELEREKGITIQSAATYTRWRDSTLNIIDTPGHVDFTIEVERALRVLDGAILLLCGVGGVQSQSITVDRQMKRYNVPRLIFVNKLDRAGANPWRAIAAAREKLKLNAAAVQIPIGLEEQHQGVVCLLRRKAFNFQGPKGDDVVEVGVPDSLKEEVEARRQELVERVSEVDDEVAELYLGEQEVSAEVLARAIRRATLKLALQPVFMGSAFKNKGVQLLLDGVVDYLPAPNEVVNTALDLSASEAPFTLPCSPTGPFVGLAFKLEEGKYGQLTYVRVYSGTIRKGDTVINSSNGKRHKLPRLVRMHADEMEDITQASAGDIVAFFGIECASGDTFTALPPSGAGNAPQLKCAMTSIRVPDPVMSLALVPKVPDQLPAFSKALQRFTREDPTFRVSTNADTGEVVVSGMGELHLEVYTERMRREYKVDCEVGKPKVNFRETITGRAEFNYLHKKQSGGAGQYGRVIGYIEPLPEDYVPPASSSSSSGGAASGVRFEFVNKLVGNNVPPEFHSAIEKGFREAVNSGSLIGAPVDGVRVVLTDGAAHAVDSSELAFRIAAVGAFRSAYPEAGATILEPIMKVEVTVPSEFQGTVMGDLNRRRGVIMDSFGQGDDAVVLAQVPLNNMFGYSTSLRSNTQGKGEFSMEYSHHMQVPQQEQQELTAHYTSGSGGSGGGRGR